MQTRGLVPSRLTLFPFHSCLQILKRMTAKDIKRQDVIHGETDVSWPASRTILFRLQDVRFSACGKIRDESR